MATFVFARSPPDASSRLSDSWGDVHAECTAANSQVYIKEVHGWMMSH